jgi:hypothetical protein
MIFMKSTNYETLHLETLYAFLLKVFSWKLHFKTEDTTQTRCALVSITASVISLFTFLGSRFKN